MAHPIRSSARQRQGTALVPQKSGVLASASRFARDQRHGGESRLIVACAEPGFQKTALMDSVLLLEAQAGATIRRVELGADRGEGAAMRLTRLSREVVGLRQRGLRVAVGVTLSGSLSEADVAREARALRKMTTAGCLVMACMRPEALDLYETLREAIHLDCHDLMGLAAPDYEYGSGLTYGIPRLLDALTFDDLAWEGRFGRGSCPGKYASAVCDVVRGCLRDTLIDEELSLRLVMVLLGTGTYDDLAMVLPRLDDEALQWLHDTCPLLGIDPLRESFAVAGCREDEVMAFCIPSLRPLCAPREHLLGAVVRALCARGRLARAELLTAILSDEAELCEIGQVWGIEFLMAGRTDALGRALRISAEAGRDQDVDSVLIDQALRELCDHFEMAAAGRERLRALTGLSARQTDTRTLVEALGACRDVWAKSRRSRRLVSKASSDHRVRSLIIHRKVLAYLFDGRFRDTYVLLLNNVQRRSVDTLCGALLCLDFCIAERFVVGTEDANALRDVRRAERIVHDVSPGRLGCYTDALGDSFAVLYNGAERLPQAERLISCSSVCQDVLAEACLLCVAAIADARSARPARAHVRAERARALARRMRATFLEDAATLVDVAARLQLGEAPRALSAWLAGEAAGHARSRTSPLLDLTHCLLGVADGTDMGDVRLEELDRSQLPHELVWALDVAVGCSGRSGGLLYDALPPAWSLVLGDRPHPPQSAPEPSRSAAEGPQAPTPSDRAVMRLVDEPATAYGDGRIHIRILGGFALEVDGVPVNPNRLNARHARELLVLLSLAKGHKVRKRDALLAIWGDIDYVKGRQRLYESISVVRRAVRTARDGLEPIVSSRSEGTICLNRSCVICDVDEFEEEAVRSISGDGDDRDAVAHSCNARRAYGAGPAVVFDDVTGIARRRTHRLKELLVSALSAGGRAALRQGRPYLASQLSREALGGEPQREDAALCLVASLTQLGRSKEVEALRDTYRRQTARGTRRPSKMLDQAFDDALEA